MNIPITEEGPGADEVASKRRYDRPVLTDLGSLAEVTLGAGASLADGPPNYGGASS